MTPGIRRSADGRQRGRRGRFQFGAKTEKPLRSDNKAGLSMKLEERTARLVLICDGDDLVAHKLRNVTTIGRASLNHIVIDDPAVSAQHAIIARSADSYRLQDLHSTNGTRVNGRPVKEVELKDGDKILFGSVAAVFAGPCRVG
jgi:pSer/pThr/pTyr-binding forkhead associated (FHA) protein